MANSSQENFGADNWAVTYTANAAVANQVIKFVPPPSDTIVTGSALASGDASSGSTTTFRDTGVRTEREDFWNGKLVKFTSGPNNGQVRLITDFVNSTTEITFSPAVGTGVANLDTYELYNGSITYRLIVTGYAITGYNTAGTVATVRLRNHKSTSAIVKRWLIAPTTGQLADSASGMWLPLVADEHLEIVIAGITGQIELTVLGRIMASTTPVAQKYDMTA